MSTDTDTPEIEATAAPKRRPGRPKRVIVPAMPSLSDEQFAQLLSVLTAERRDGLDADTLKTAFAEAAVMSAKTMQKAMKPENTDHPGIGALTYPEGDVKRPRPVLPYELWWNSYPMHMFPETEHWRELELACQLTPGHYTVLRKDGSKMVVDITAEKDADGKITRLDTRFEETRESKWLTPPKMVTLYQIVHSDQLPRQAFLEAMQEYFGLMFGDRAIA